MSDSLQSTRTRLERSARDLLYGTGLFFPVRSAYQFVFKREKVAFRRRMKHFYAAFVRRGDLVFDVGANDGVYTEVFSDLGGKVIAVEPNPRCCQNLKLLSRGHEVQVLNCAASDSPGRATLRICEEPVLSTLSDIWYEAARRSSLFRDVKWLGTMEVDLVTLDELAKRFGVPSFVKIDVECYDDRVLQGMSFRPAALSFEFNGMVPQVAMRCLEAPILLEGYRFNFMRALEMRLASECWMQADELRQRLECLEGKEEYGDVLARRTN